MPLPQVVRSFFRTLLRIAHTFSGMVGFIPENMTIVRAIFMVPSLLFFFWVLPQHKEVYFASVYFLLGLVSYLFFLFFMLRQNGGRQLLIRRFGEEKAYRIYEGILAFLFFHNGASVGFMSESSPGTGFWGGLPLWLVWGTAAVLFAFGLVVKLWSTMLIGIPVYYWKDIFVGHKVSEFVIAGPYRFFNNPIYGVGHLPGYAVAIYNNSFYGIMASAINQLCVYAFYFWVEKPFVIKTYLTAPASVNAGAISAGPMPGK
ncbi:MAG: phosphatidylethanolamine N-methyltransferase family protein [Turneriella sp.]|nr:phosphatidylethanolamine N-methyltransferase family protein [Turneriella sp.]